MSYMKNLALETRTCGEAEEDARLDRRDGLTQANRTRWAAAHKRLDAIGGKEMNAAHQDKLEREYVAYLDAAQETDTLERMLALHAAAWWRDIEAEDFVEKVNETYAAYLAAGGNDAHYGANWRRLSDAAKEKAALLSRAAALLRGE